MFAEVLLVVPTHRPVALQNGDVIGGWVRTRARQHDCAAGHSSVPPRSRPLSSTLSSSASVCSLLARGTNRTMLRRSTIDSPIFLPSRSTSSPECDIRSLLECTMASIRGARAGDRGRQTHQAHQARQHNTQLLVAAARSGRGDEERGVQSTHPFLRARHCRVCVCVGCHLLRTISPQGLQIAMTSAERCTSAEAENSRLPHREVTGGLLHPPWQSISPRADDRLLLGFGLANVVLVPSALVVAVIL